MFPFCSIKKLMIKTKGLSLHFGMEDKVEDVELASSEQGIAFTRESAVLNRITALLLVLE